MRIFNVSALLALLMISSSPILAADSYQVDSVHTFINFKVLRSGFSYVVGRFNSFSGSATWDDADPAGRSLEITIDAGSVDTGNERRDQHLTSPDFFNAKQFPQIIFKASQFKETSVEGFDAAWEAAGELTLHGVTKPLTVVLKQVGKGEDRRGNFNIGVQAEFTIKRSEFGMTNMIPMGGDEVTCYVDVLVQRQ